MDKINKRIAKPDSIGIFHDTRKDAKVIRDVLNMLISKIDELVESNNYLQNQVEKLKNN